MDLRREEPGDRDAVHAVVSAAFGRADEADLVDRLRADGDVAVALVAEDAGAPIGHVVLSRMVEPAGALALGPVAVAPWRQAAGIGAALVRASLDAGRAPGWRLVFVLGEPRYYTRFGFTVAAAGGYASRYAGPHFMALALHGGDPGGGVARHARAFG